MCASLGLKEFGGGADLAKPIQADILSRASVRQNDTNYFVYHNLTARKQKGKTLGAASVEVQPSRISTPARVSISKPYTFLGVSPSHFS